MFEEMVAYKKRVSHLQIGSTYHKYGFVEIGEMRFYLDDLSDEKKKKETHPFALLLLVYYICYKWELILCNWYTLLHHVHYQHSHVQLIYLFGFQTLLMYLSNLYRLLSLYLSSIM